MNFIDCFNKTNAETETLTKEAKKEKKIIKEFASRHMPGTKYEKTINSYSTVRHVLKLYEAMAANIYTSNKFINPLGVMLDKDAKMISMSVKGSNVYIDIKKTIGEKGTLTFSYGLKKLEAKDKEDNSLDFYIGEKVDGGAEILSLNSAYPHLLVGGMTGSGKSIAINNMILSLLTRYSKDEVNIYTIDPKNETFFGYQKAAPDIFIDNATEKKDAMRLLLDVESILQDRLDNLFPKEEAWGIDDYNEVANKRVPYIVVVIEEADSLFAISPNDTSSLNIRNKVVEMAKKYRSAGLRLVIVTQQPSAKNLTTELRDQCSMRIALHMEPTASRMVLGNKLAATLTNGGDCYIKTEEGGTNRVQTALITRAELRKAQKWLEKNRRK